MIVGNGVDILEIQRIQDILVRRPTFTSRFFTPLECAYFEAKAMRSETIAANFAAKEAVAKSFGTGVRGFELKEIEVLRDELGKPYVILHGRAKVLADALGITELQLSLSHSNTMVIAFVIAIGGL